MGLIDLLDALSLNARNNNFPLKPLRKEVNIYNIFIGVRFKTNSTPLSLNFHCGFVGKFIFWDKMICYCCGWQRKPTRHIFKNVLSNINGPV